MRGRVVFGAIAAAIWLVAFPVAVLAHGDDDARAIARGLSAGPYVISLWQVEAPSTGVMTPHVIVIFDGGAPAPKTGVTVTVNGSPMDDYLSTTTRNSWETTQGVVEGESLAVTITDGTNTWSYGPAVVPASPISMLPMKEVILAAMFVTIGSIVWMARRTAHVWRRSAARPIQRAATKLSEG